MATREKTLQYRILLGEVRGRAELATGAVLGTGRAGIVARAAPAASGRGT